MKKQLQGTVKSAKMTKAVTVEVIRFSVHPKYLKRIKVTKSFAVRNEVGAKAGDNVIIEETKPQSKTIHWQITKII